MSAICDHHSVTITHAYPLALSLMSHKLKLYHVIVALDGCTDVARTSIC